MGWQLSMDVSLEKWSHGHSGMYPGHFDYYAVRFKVLLKSPHEYFCFRGNLTSGQKDRAL